MTDSEHNILAFPDLEGIDATAAEWIVRIDKNDMSAQEYSAFVAWRDASEQHRDAFDRLSALWESMDAVEALNDYAEADQASEVISQIQLSALTKRVLLTGALPAAVVAAGVGAVVFAPDLFRPASGTFRTAIGGQKSVRLADGTLLELNTNSEVKVAYSKAARIVHLVRGEVFSEVTSDRMRPFTIVTDRGNVTAVGTAFSVRLHDDKVDVMVAEGRVAVAPKVELRVDPDQIDPSVSQEIKTEVAAGHGAVFGAKVEAVVPFEPAVMARKLLWRDGVLAFSGDPLFEVVEDVSRYTDISIEIADEDLRDLPVAGYLKVGDVDAMFEALEVMAGLHTEWIDSKKVLLTRAKDA